MQPCRSLSCSTPPAMQQLAARRPAGSRHSCSSSSRRLHRGQQGSVHAAVARSAPEKVQQGADAAAAAAAAAADAAAAQQQQQQRQFVRVDSLSTLQEEQESELTALTKDVPRMEQRFEWLAFWVGAAVAFGAGIWYVEGAEKAAEFFAGYLLEQSLSIDNLFVFVLVFSYFKTPLAAQPKVLTYGIATAAGLRAVLILLGTELIQKFEPLLLGFALILLWSSYGLLTKGDGDEDEDLSDNAIVVFCRRLLPVSDAYDGTNFFTTPAGAAAAAAAAGGGSSSAAAAAAASGSSSSGPVTSGGSSSLLGLGGRVATPLLLTLAVVELSDVLFAVDSIPAVFGVTLDPFIVYTSNMFAILSLRSLYSFVSTVMTELRFLDKAVAIVLGFIGLKMIAQFGDVNVPTDVSLLVVGLVLGGGVAASMLLPEGDDA